jgi:hypothetical protein
MEQFLDKLHRFIAEVQAMPRFRGQTKAVAALKRIQNLAAFK